MDIYKQRIFAIGLLFSIIFNYPFLNILKFDFYLFLIPFKIFMIFFLWFISILFLFLFSVFSSKKENSKETNS